MPRRSELETGQEVERMEETAVTRWELVCAEQDLPVEDMIRVDLDGKAYVVYHIKSGFFATEGLCTHERASLADGLVEGEIVVCPKHNSRFHIPTGKALRIPAKVDLKTFPVKNEGGKVYLGIP
jgi:3-phenylpropionate/trans-cinnamate dioxygenase ferredoxin component